MVNAPVPNRLQLLLGSVQGPLVSPVLGPFDPRRDLGIYYNGDKVVPTSYLYDAPNNRYLMYFDQNFVFDPSRPMVQVIHHMPNPPFSSLVTSNPGIELLAAGRSPGILAGTQTPGGV
jgi:hypothetical protein